MSEIRKKSIRGTTWIYVGFLVGALNVYLFTHKSWFASTEYGLTNSMRDIAILVSAISTLGVPSFLSKFFPYYQDHTTYKENDMLGFALKISMAGFLIMAFLTWIGQPIIIQKFGTKSPLLVEYFYFTLPMAFGYMLFSLLEAYSYGYHRSILTNFLKEFLVRFYTLLVILLKMAGLISFKAFIFLFVLQYLVIAAVLGFVLHREGKLPINFKESRVTKRFKPKIYAMLFLTSTVIIAGALRPTIDSLVISSRIDLEHTAIFGFATFLMATIQAPYRSVVSVVTPVLSRAWKDKNMHEIRKIYKRTSINLLTISLFVFFCIWLNFEEAIRVFNLKEEYVEGKWVVFIIGLTTIIEMGTGVNSQIIGSSTYWRFEFYTNLILTVFIVLLSYLFTVKYGMIGPALANLISFAVYNFIRYLFLKNKFGMQPFTRKTVEIIVGAVAIYYATYLIFRNVHGIFHLAGTLVFFTAFYFLLVYLRNISPDLKPVLASITKKFKK